MHSNVMTVDREVIELNESLYGTTKINYNPVSLGLAGQEKTYDVGSLAEKSFSEVSYSLAEEFPADQIASALKPTMTELAQVTAVSSTFGFCKFAKGVEFKVSNIGDTSMANVNAGINKELWKEWDSAVYLGQFGTNEGFKNHSKGHSQASVAALSFDSLVAEVTGAMNRLVSASDITSDQYGLVTFLHSAEVTAVLRKYETGSEISNSVKFQALFPGLVGIEAPKNIMPDGLGEFLLVLRDSVKLHRSSVPALYGQDQGKYGLSTDSLFTYESAAVELEVEGAIQEVTFIA
jgi:hypothetical protein